MGERVLSRRELNRALLARQLLLRRERLPVARAIERVGALQAQWPPAPYVALWSRLDGFERRALETAIARRSVVKATLMRTTLHHVSARDYLAYAGLLRRAREPELTGRLERTPASFDLDAVVDGIQRLTTEAPRGRPELFRRLGLPRLVATDPPPWVVWHLAVARLGLVHGPEASAWRRNTAGGTFVPAAVWLGADADGDDAAAATHLVRRYLAAFGPATRADVAQWTGLPLRLLDPGLERLRLRRLRDEQGRVLLDLPRAPLPSGEVEAPVRFLPAWDSTLLAHDDRTRILPAEHRATVIRRNGDVQQTFLVDGVVAGLWQLDDGRVRLEPFAPLPARVRRELEAEATGLAELHA